MRAWLAHGERSLIGKLSEIVFVYQFETLAQDRCVFVRSGYLFWKFGAAEDWARNDPDDDGRIDKQEPHNDRPIVKGISTDPNGLR